MNYKLIKDVIDLVEQYETEIQPESKKENSVENFKQWVINGFEKPGSKAEPQWEGKNMGRSAESAIATQIVHMNRFGKAYFKSVLMGTDITSQDDVIYLIVLKFNKNLTKMDLIRKNVQDKPAGMQIINRLINRGWVEQSLSGIDKRSKVLKITDSGLKLLDGLFEKIRDATNIVAADLTHAEKMELIRLLDKLDKFHLDIYEKNIDAEQLLEYSLGQINN